MICESIPRFAALDTALNVSIYWGLTNITVHLDQTFTYKEDPSILKVEPLTSIIRYSWNISIMYSIKAFKNKVLS